MPKAHEGNQPQSDVGDSVATVRMEREVATGGSGRPWGNLNAQVPTASGLTALDHGFTARKFVALG